MKIAKLACPLLRFRILSFFTLAFGLSFTAMAADYTSTLDGFSIAFPATPDHSVGYNPSPVGKIKEHRYSVQNTNGQFIVEVSMLPGIAISFGGRRTIYRRAEKAFLKDTQATKISSQTQEVQGYLANILNFKSTKGEQGQALFLLVEKRLYLLVGKSLHNSSAVQAFLSSFRLVDV